jgi:hypothetical protein
MTEAEWHATDDLEQMLALLSQQSAQREVSSRKLRLLKTGCLRAVWKSLAIKPIRQALIAAELFADGCLSKDELKSANRNGIVAFLRTSDRHGKRTSKNPELLVKLLRMGMAVDSAQESIDLRSLNGIGNWKDLRMSDPVLHPLGPVLLRCVVGNPFRPVAFDPRWRTADVTALARGIYEERAFDRLPLLADALMDAGCDSDDALTHCRSDGPHVRGCWVVDLVLGKE